MAKKKDYKKEKSNKLKQKQSLKEVEKKNKIEKDNKKKYDTKIAQEKAKKKKENEVQNVLKQKIKYKPKLGKVIEAIFYILYLIFLVVSIVLLLLNFKNNVMTMFACLAGIMLFGECFYLLPRIISNLGGSTENTDFWCGLGKKISIVTMPVFYLVLGLILYEIYILKIDNYYFWILLVDAILSFILYLPAMIFGKKHPRIGMLMIPKIICFICVIAMGLNLIFIF